MLGRIARNYIDLNRDADDIAPELLEALRPGDPPSRTSELGLGLIRRLIVPGAPIYASKLPAAEIQARLDGIYHPYHHARQPNCTRCRAGLAMSGMSIGIR